MNRDKPIRLAPGHTQWSSEELSKIDELAAKKNRKRDLQKLFPDRSLGAVRLKLSRKRRELGIAKPNIAEYGPEIEPTMLDPNDPGLPDYYSPKWRAAAERANQRFLAAMLAAA